MNHLTKKIFMNQKMKKKERQHMGILNGDQTESKNFLFNFLNIFFFMKYNIFL